MRCLLAFGGSHFVRTSTSCASTRTTSAGCGCRSHCGHFSRIVTVQSPLYLAGTIASSAWFCLGATLGCGGHIGNSTVPWLGFTAIPSNPQMKPPARLGSTLSYDTHQCLQTVHCISSLSLCARAHRRRQVFGEPSGHQHNTAKSCTTHAIAADLHRHSRHQLLRVCATTCTLVRICHDAQGQAQDAWPRS